MADVGKRQSNVFKFVYFDGNNESTEGSGEGPGKKKKKPRPITSCQSCRRRKIKCINAMLPCEACVESGDRCSLLDPPPEQTSSQSAPRRLSAPSLPMPKPPSPSSSSHSGSSSHPSGGPSPGQPPAAALPARPIARPTSSSGQQGSFYQQHQYQPLPQPQPSTSYSPSSLASQPLKRPSSTVSSARSPPPSSSHAYNQIRHFDGDPSAPSSSSSAHKRPRYSLPNPTPPYLAPQPARLPQPIDRPFGPSSRSTQPSSSSTTTSSSVKGNSLAFLLHPWSPANDEFGPGRVRGEKVEPLPPGVGVGLGLANGALKGGYTLPNGGAAGASGGDVTYKVPALPNGSRPPLSTNHSNGSYGASATPATPAHPLLAPNLHFSLPPPSVVSSPVSRPLQPPPKSGTTSTVSTSHASSSSSAAGSSSTTRASASASLAASSTEGSASATRTTAVEERRVFDERLGFMFPWLAEESREEKRASVRWAVESWAARIGTAVDGDERARALLERAKGVALMGDLGVEALETLLMISWAEYGLSGPKTAWLFCSFAARIIESLSIDHGLPTPSNGSNTRITSPSSATPSPPSSLTPATLPPHLHLSLSHLSTLLALALPSHPHIHVPPPPPPSPTSDPETLPEAWSAVMHVLSQLATHLRHRSAEEDDTTDPQQQFSELKGQARDLSARLSEKGGALDPATSEGAEERLALGVWVMGVEVLFNTPSLLPDHLARSNKDEEEKKDDDDGDDMAISSALTLSSLLLTPSTPHPDSLAILARTFPFLATPVKWALHVLDQPCSAGAGAGAEEEEDMEREKERERRSAMLRLKGFLAGC